MGNAAKIESLRATAVERHRAGALEEADHLYTRILSLHSRDVEARHMLAVLRLQQGRANEALEIIAGVAVDAPASPDVRTHHGLILHHLGRHPDAMAEFEAALCISPGYAMTLLYRGNALLDLGHFSDALIDYETLLRAAPQYDEAWFRRGNGLWHLDRFEEALDSYTRVLTLNPAHVAALFNCGTVLLRLGRYGEAFEVLERLRAVAPNHPYALGAAAGALLGCCDFTRWAEYQAQVVKAVRNCNAVIAPLSFLPFCDDGALRRICAETFVTNRVAPPGPILWTGERYNHARLRIAYLSADFHQHATAELIAGLIERHDRARFEVMAISFSRDDGSAMRARLIDAFDRFDDVRAVSDMAVARLLREREVDLAIDLKGHTEGARPAILSHRPCPVQVSYLGYPGTTSALWLDYIIGDATVLPFAHQSFYSEKIVHLPHCYQVNDATRAVAKTALTRAAARLPENGFVFCCFNAPWKIAPAMFYVWMRLLGGVPGSVIWLLDDNPAATANLRAAALACGVDPGRLVFAPATTPAEHLARHQLADLFLDTLPYNAHTTASDALWVGLPVITCLGALFDGRVAASLLGAVGLPDLITHTMQEYEALALSLARDPARLKGLQARLAANRLCHPLYDTDRFRRALEMAYIRMIEVARGGGAPESFAVPD
ncbi:MAG TPA: tetratricopeptide repeat protein [Rhizomicrobium sp.]|jgi:predicted O-linked N-acetylglucosamine transferase (SPINDLY family)